eukprot:GHRQ01036037.1.p2 GENE.GHRQ01036037.1~~GHRQ01036037.1.p2  ORF type:complete len:127 (+),score=5.05 GHRQ01036037.1:284-664(+)
MLTLDQLYLDRHHAWDSSALQLHMRTPNALALEEVLRQPLRTLLGRALQAASSCCHSSRRALRRRVLYMHQPKLAPEAVGPFKAVKKAPGVPADQLHAPTGHCFTHAVQILPVVVDPARVKHTCKD